ncbi:MAG: SGNH/GDSL hydrolase family protein [Kiritimatiellae bacterium]|nr:SGNH/GDSL hydrolase family protein [Kiritimatiellia bacterium]
MKTVRGMIMAGLLVALVAPAVAEVHVVENALTNATAVVISGEYSLTGAGGVQMPSLTLTAGSRFTLDPVRTPVLITGQAAPTFAVGAKIALDAAYANYTKGRMVLLTWHGTEQATIPAGLFDASSAAGVNPTLTQETYTAQKATSSTYITYTRLVLDLNPAAEKRRVTIMPFGDSITESSSVVGFGNPNYRVFLMQKLAARGYAPESVGFRHSNNQNAAAIYQDDAYSWHGGISGIRLIPKGDPNNRGGYREGLDTLLEATGVPDIILFFIGANDDGWNMDEMFESWTNAVTRLATMRPTTKIISVAVMKQSGTWRKNFHDRISAAIADNVLGLPPNQLHFVNPDIGFPHSDARYTQTPNNQHPSWMGHDLTSSTFADKIEEVLQTPPVKTADGSADAVYTPNRQTGVLANVHPSYTRGFQRLWAIDACDVSTNGAKRLIKNGTMRYSYANPDLDSAAQYVKVGYYLELRHKLTGHVRWVWADMDTWDGGTPDTFAFPLAYRLQRKVTGLHVLSNDSGIKTVAPEDDSVEGWLQFANCGYVTNACSEVDAPAKMFPYDWNMTLDDARAYGLMQIYRLEPDGPRPHLPAELLMAYNRWEGDGTHEIGIGGCSMHNFINYMGSNSSAYDRFNLNGYDLANLEIWGLPAAAEMSVAPRAGYDFTNAVAMVDVARLAAGAEDDFLQLTLTDTTDGVVVGQVRLALANGATDYELSLPGPLVPGRTYLYRVEVVDAEGAVVRGSSPIEGTLMQAVGGAPTTWFSASAASGASQVQAGQWEQTPAIVEQAYRFGPNASGTFTVDEKPAHLAACTVVEQRLTFDDVALPADLARKDLSDKQCGLTIALGNRWYGLAGGQWRYFDGPPAVCGTYDVRFEVDYATQPGRVRYSVKASGAAAYVALTVDGADWVANSRPAATRPLALEYDGEGSLTKVTGAAADVGVAAVAGRIYATAGAAVAEAAKTGETVFLRTNATLPADQLAAGAKVAADGHDFLWEDGANYIGADAETGLLEIKTKADGAAMPPNGLKSWESHMLGLNPDDPTSVPRVALTKDEETGDFIVSVENVNPREEAKVQYEIESGADVRSLKPEGKLQDSKVFPRPSTGRSGFYRVRIHVAR